mmetsp:Transcript_47360/g.111657  ORF Transcript_47360/g.111657 Transcript_47360/m.111657 type:complete len:235 (-) Transcript_47360:928-1632(-)
MLRTWVSSSATMTPSPFSSKIWKSWRSWRSLMARVLLLSSARISRANSQSLIRPSPLMSAISVTAFSASSLRFIPIFLKSARSSLMSSQPVCDTSASSKRRSACSPSDLTAWRSMTSAWKPSSRCWCTPGRSRDVAWSTIHGCWRASSAVKRLEASTLRSPRIKSLQGGESSAQSSFDSSILPLAMLERISESLATAVGSKGLHPHSITYMTTPRAHMSMPRLTICLRTISGAQ